MRNIVDFLDKWSMRIMLPLVLIVFFKTCSTNGRIEKVEDNISNKHVVTDSIIKAETISKDEIQKMLAIEGLKVEKRMIQATDRKMLDVNRQTEIDKEIEKLENN